MSSEADQLVIYEYNQRFPNTVSMYMVDTSDDSEVERISDLMRGALKSDEPLDDSIFEMPEGSLS